MIWLALAALAAEPAVDEPTCSVEALAELPEPPDRLAVAWVAPWHRRPSGWLEVVSTADLRTWLKAQDPPWTGRTLQWLGLRRRPTDPRRRWKVVVLEVERDQLCRPVADVEEGVDVAGVLACPARLGKPDAESRGCGRTTDRRTGDDAIARYAVRRKDATDRGYCAVPLDRYVDEVGRTPER